MISSLLQRGASTNITYYILHNATHKKNLATKQCNFQHFLLHLEVAQFHFSMEIHSRDCSLLKRGSKELKIIIPEKFLPHQHHRRSQVYLVKSFLNLLIINISLKTYYFLYICTLPTVPWASERLQNTKETDFVMFVLI